MQRETGKRDKNLELVGDLELNVKTIVEYITVTNWSTSFAYIKNAIYDLRNTTSSANVSSESPNSYQISDRLALAVARVLPFFCVDGPKLGLIVQELCSSYLHFRKSYQDTVAFALPPLIMRWIERHPDQFVRLHSLHKRFDGGADTLFDMTQTGNDNGKRKSALYPLQLTLLLLLPDVFEVASNMSETRSTSMLKKVSFLDGLRKALKNGNERAGYCLVALLRVARYFDGSGEAALASFAMDVQNEVKDAIFNQPASGSPDAVFGQDMITGALVSLASLNINGRVAAPINSCMASCAPNKQKIAIVQACSYFAKHPHSLESKTLLGSAIPFMQSHFEVRLGKAWCC